MSAIYMTTQGATIQRRSVQFLVCKGSEILQNIPEAHVRQFVLFGNVNISTPAVAFCLDKRIDVVFLTQGGRFRGRLNGDGGKSAELRSQQYERAHDKEFCLAQARAIVAGKITNLISVARRQNNGTQGAQEFRGLGKRSTTLGRLAPLRRCLALRVLPQLLTLSSSAHGYQNRGASANESPTLLEIPSTQC
jgi:CRISPR-associated endonuclease Cas1